MFAEALWILSEEGDVLPLEIAFAENPRKVILFEIKPPESVHWTLCHYKGFRNKDRFYNSTPQRHSPIQPWATFILEAHSWLPELIGHLERLYPQGSPIRVRGKAQWHFFTKTCNFPNVRRISIPTGCKVMGCVHRHISPHPCAGIEVRTMARQYHKLIG